MHSAQHPATFRDALDASAGSSSREHDTHSAKRIKKNNRQMQKKEKRKRLLRLSVGYLYT